MELKIPIFIYPDPASRQRKTSAGGRTDLSILQNGGFTVKVKHRHPAVRDRINAVNSKLKDSKGNKTYFCFQFLQISYKRITKTNIQGRYKYS